jgi:hypothetical protein
MKRKVVQAFGGPLDGVKLMVPPCKIIIGDNCGRKS